MAEDSWRPKGGYVAGSGSVSSVSTITQEEQNANFRKQQSETAAKVANKFKSFTKDDGAKRRSKVNQNRDQKFLKTTSSVKPHVDDQDSINKNIGSNFTEVERYYHSDYVRVDPETAEETPVEGIELRSADGLYTFMYREIKSIKFKTDSGDTLTLNFEKYGSLGKGNDNQNG